jgi:two-component system, sensor histidine kinase and response regulator
VDSLHPLPVQAGPSIGACTVALALSAAGAAALWLGWPGLLAAAPVAAGGAVLARRQRRDGARQQARAQELANLALVARVTDNAVVITDHAGRTTWVNEAFTRLSGYTLADAAGRTPGSLLQCDRTEPRTVQRLRDAIAKREAVQVEILNRAKDGRVYWLQLDVQPLQEAPGGLPGFIAVSPGG